MSDCPLCGLSHSDCSCPKQDHTRECSINNPHKSFFDCDCEICRPPKKLRRRTDSSESAD
ncbi:hypothetical protein [Bacillus sp. NEB1478]|uniref:hypothetical protein n=1 Tax=Bacillus sp. NEB1478 TaxID=3073816 RepID=UPI002873C188|nr:hypothetical protein [Bacillus sp. NEB1478]WNB92146.1 hypothetical protein RGB74_00350 [Bacillus sp. NEB1478]